MAPYIEGIDPFPGASAVAGVLLCRALMLLRGVRRRPAGVLAAERFLSFNRLRDFLAEAAGCDAFASVADAVVAPALVHNFSEEGVEGDDASMLSTVAISSATKEVHR